MVEVVVDRPALKEIPRYTVMQVSSGSGSPSRLIVPAFGAAKISTSSIVHGG